jgi:hypothetical protein
MCRQRLKLSPAGIYKRIYQKLAHSTGCRLMINPFVCYTLNTSPVHHTLKALADLSRAETILVYVLGVGRGGERGDRSGS